MKRTSDIVEGHSVRALVAGIGALIAFAAAAVFLVYGGDAMKGLAYVFLAAGVGGAGYALYCGTQIRKVPHVEVTCVFCQAANRLSEAPTKDFTCSSCHRLVPVKDGHTLPVQQVRCGFCNELNYYSEKTEVLLCEYCNHDIPVAREDGSSMRQSAFAVKDDNQVYELRLVSHGKRDEDLINALQHILALNRNQVKQMLTELPVTLLSGIPRKKAEMLTAQLAVHDGVTEYSPVNN